MHGDSNDASSKVITNVDPNELAKSPLVREFMMRVIDTLRDPLTGAVFVITLADVANEYNRYNRTKLGIAGNDARHLTISGTRPATDLDAFARGASKSVNLRVERHEGEIVVSR